MNALMTKPKTKIGIFKWSSQTQTHAGTKRTWLFKYLAKYLIWFFGYLLVSGILSEGLPNISPDQLHLPHIHHCGPDWDVGLHASLGQHKNEWHQYLSQLHLRLLHQPVGPLSCHWHLDRNILQPEESHEVISWGASACVRALHYLTSSEGTLTHSGILGHTEPTMVTKLRQSVIYHSMFVSNMKLSLEEIWTFINKFINYQVVWNSSQLLTLWGFS